MRIVAVELVDWRNYERLVFEPGRSPTVLVGLNGQGKTNFIESIVYAALGHSHRTSSDAVLVRSGCRDAIIRLTVAHAERRLTVDITVTASGTNLIRLAGNPVKRRELVQHLPLVLFAPEDIELVRGEPEFRRGFLADVFTETSARLVADLGDYDRILKQRNSLLKSSGGSTAVAPTLDAWTESLVTVGARVMAARRAIVADLAPRAAEHYSALSGGGQKLVISLSESVPSDTADADLADSLRHAFHVKHSEELDRGTTLVGPHRDDLALTLNDLPARTHSSQGEAWSCALALRLAMVDIVRRHSLAGDPVVILDDVFSELDPARRERLAAHVATIEHLIVTAADTVTIPDALRGETHHVESGRIDE